MRKMTEFMKQKGYLTEPSSRECLNRSGRAFIGDPCSCEQDCAFWNAGVQGFCHPAGFCSLPCEGTCPDASGKASTFCIEDTNSMSIDLAFGGICVSKAEEVNGHCADLPETLDQSQPRFVGTSSSSQKDALVCVPQ